MAVIQSGASTDLVSVNAQKQLLVTPSARVRTGVYLGNSGLLSVQVAAHAATAGFVWLINPVGSARIVSLRRAEVDSMGVAASASIARLQVERMTFTGVSTGAVVASGKIDSTYPNPVAILTSASTGMVITAGPILYSWLMMAVITAAGVSEPVLGEWEPSEDGQPVLRAGEGLVFRQPDAGVATDPRRLVINIAWEEY